MFCRCTVCFAVCGSLCCGASARRGTAAHGGKGGRTRQIWRRTYRYAYWLKDEDGSLVYHAYDDDMDDSTAFFTYLYGRQQVLVYEGSNVSPSLLFKPLHGFYAQDLAETINQWYLVYSETETVTSVAPSTQTATFGKEDCYEGCYDVVTTQDGNTFTYTVDKDLRVLQMSIGSADGSKTEYTYGYEDVGNLSTTILSSYDAIAWLGSDPATITCTVNCNGEE